MPLFEKFIWNLVVRLVVVVVTTTAVVCAAEEPLCSSSSSSSISCSSSSSRSFSTASFIQPALPPTSSLSSSLPEDILWIANRKKNRNNNKKQAPSMMMMTTMRRIPTTNKSTTTRRTTLLFGKKKSGSSSGGSKSGKVQIKLLKHVAGTGQAGDVVLVTPAFFQNKLQPTKAAVIISDEEVAKENEEQQKLQEQINAMATKIKNKLSSTATTDSEDEETVPKLIIPRKVGPTGHLFGSISAKVILQELVEDSNKDATIQLEEGEKQFINDSKSVKVISIKDNATNKKMRSDIKEMGTYTATIALTKEISTDLIISVESDTTEQ